MDRELRGYVIEIIIMVIFLVIAIPICVDASSRYNDNKQKVLNGLNTTIDVLNNGDMKTIYLYNSSNDSVKVKLGMMISKFYDEYLVTVDDSIYNLNELEYLEDDSYRYYVLGTYEIDDIEIVDFDLKIKDKSYFDDEIAYGFYVEGLV